MKEKRIKSPVPFYIVAAVWLIAALFVPLYRLTALLIMALVSVAVYFAASKLFPGQVIMVETPVDTGDAEVDACINTGRDAVKELERLEKSIGGQDMPPKIARLRESLGKILAEAERDGADQASLKRFTDYYVPVTLKILRTYETMCEQGVEGQNIAEAKSRVEGILDMLCTAYDKQLDSMFEAEALDITTDIDVLEGMIGASGLAGGDFDDVLGKNS